MDIDIIPKPGQLTVYLSLPWDTEPGDWHRRTIARFLHCKAQDITWHSIHSIAQDDALNQNEADRWDDARRKIMRLWRLQGKINAQGESL